ncbi:MAG: MFS transporter [Pseudomonadota bacterium]|nr:MAG: MFS transporter [Pseudomonadota bacterium]
MNLRRMVDLRPDERAGVLWSFLYFFALLSSYYILRPLRDEMGITGGVEQLHWMFTGTFLAMLLAVPLFGAAARTLPRHVLLPAVYAFFIVNLLVFHALLQSGIATVYVARAFFIWVSVFNLFVVSVFWSFMADLFSNAQARRLFGFIAAGGSLGALLGPGLTAALAGVLGPFNLLPISALLLGVALLCITRLLAWSGRHGGVESRPHADNTDRAIGGGMLDGIRLVFRSRYLLAICLYIWLFTTLSTFLYFQQAHIVRGAFDDPAQRTAVFAGIDLAVNALTILVQLFVTHRLIARLGLGKTLALLPALMALGFACLGAAPVLAVLVPFQVLRRAGNYAVAKPAREILFTVVSRAERYKAKNLIDTVVYRGGDALSGWLFAGLSGLGLGLAGIALLALPVAAMWMVTGLWLGRWQERLRALAPTETGDYAQNNFTELNG